MFVLFCFVCFVLFCFVLFGCSLPPQVLPPPVMPVLLEKPEKQAWVNSLKTIAGGVPGPAALNPHDTPLFYMYMHMNDMPTGFTAARQKAVLLNKEQDEDNCFVEPMRTWWRKVHIDITTDSYMRLADNPKYLSCPAGSRSLPL